MLALSDLEIEEKVRSLDCLASPHFYQSLGGFSEPHMVPLRYESLSLLLVSDSAQAGLTDLDVPYSSQTHFLYLVGWVVNAWGQRQVTLY